MSLDVELYEMVTQEWTKKQKIVDNLCHFSRKYGVTQLL